MADNGIRTRYLWLSKRGDTHTFVLIKVLPALQYSLSIMGNFRKRKKAQTTELNIFLSKNILPTKNNKNPRV